MGLRGIEPLSFGLKARCISGLPQTLVNLAMTVGSHQHALVEFVFDLLPTQTPVARDLEVLFAWIYVVELERAFTAIVPAYLTFATFVVQTSFVHRPTPLRYHARIALVLSMSLLAIVLILSATVSTRCHA